MPGVSAGINECPESLISPRLKFWCRLGPWSFATESCVRSRHFSLLDQQQDVFDLTLTKNEKKLTTKAVGWVGVGRYSWVIKRVKIANKTVVCRKISVVIIEGDAIVHFSFKHGSIKHSEGGNNMKITNKAGKLPPSTQCSNRWAGKWDKLLVRTIWPGSHVPQDLVGAHRRERQERKVV